MSRGKMGNPIAVVKEMTPPEIGSTICGWVMYGIAHICTKEVGGWILLIFALIISWINVQSALSRRRKNVSEEKRAEVELKRSEMKLKKECGES